MSIDTNQLEAASDMDIEINMNPRPISFLEITQEERNSLTPSPGQKLMDHFQRCMRHHEETGQSILVMTDVDDAERAFELWEESYTGGRIDVVDGRMYLFEFNSECHCDVSCKAADMFAKYLRNESGLNDSDDYKYYIGNGSTGRVTTTDNKSGMEADARFKRVPPRNSPSWPLKIVQITSVVIEVGDCQKLAHGDETHLLNKAHRWIRQNASLVVIVKLYGHSDPDTRNRDPGMLVCLVTRDGGVFNAARIGSVPDRDIQNLNEYNRAHLIQDPNAPDIDIREINTPEGAELEIEGHLIYGMDRDPRPHLNTIIADASQPPDGIEEDESLTKRTKRERVRRAAQALYTRVNNNGGTFQPCRINVFDLWLFSLETE